jgi:hypothetical protein
MLVVVARSSQSKSDLLELRLQAPATVQVTMEARHSTLEERQAAGSALGRDFDAEWLDDLPDELRAARCLDPMRKRHCLVDVGWSEIAEEAHLLCQPIIVAVRVQDCEGESVHPTGAIVGHR